MPMTSAAAAASALGERVAADVDGQPGVPASSPALSRAALSAVGEVGGGAVVGDDGVRRGPVRGTVPAVKGSASEATCAVEAPASAAPSVLLAASVLARPGPR